MEGLPKTLESTIGEGGLPPHSQVSRCDQRSSKVVKLVMRLHHGSPKVVKLEVGLHQGCYTREHEVSRGGEASDGALPPKMQEGEVHDGTSPWESQGA